MRGAVRPLCNIPYMPQGPICHKPIVQHALCVTIPICYSTKPFMRRVLCATAMFGVRSTPLLPQWHVKDPGHFAESADGRLHLNTHTPLTKRSRSGLTTPLSRHSVRTYPETSSHATCQGTSGHSRLSSLSHCGLILA